MSAIFGYNDTNYTIVHYFADPVIDNIPIDQVIGTLGQVDTPWRPVVPIEGERIWLPLRPCMLKFCYAEPILQDPGNNFL